MTDASSVDLSMIEASSSGGGLRQAYIAGLRVSVADLPTVAELLVRPPPDVYSKDLARIRSLPAVPMRCTAGEGKLQQFLGYLGARQKAACVRGYAEAGQFTALGAAALDSFVLEGFLLPGDDPDQHGELTLYVEFPAPAPPPPSPPPPLPQQQQQQQQLETAPATEAPPPVPPQLPPPSVPDATAAEATDGVSDAAPHNAGKKRPDEFRHDPSVPFKYDMKNE